jgi:hypothetical protein
MVARPAMHKDANLRKRNALVIPGGLLAFYGLVGMLYVLVVRGDSGTCGDASLIVFAGACRSAVLVMAIPIVIGLALVGVGAFAFRGMATCRQGHGSWTHFTLALLVSLAVVPILGMVLAPSLLGAGATFARNGVNYPISTLLGGIAGVGVLMLVPFGFLYAGQTRANPCCQEKGCFSPCFCDEPAAEEPAPETPPAAPAAGPPDWEVVGASKPETPTAPTPSVPASPPETPPAAPPAEPAKSRASGSAPPLATRPTDPAAGPADEMAAAVEWTQDEDEDSDEGAAGSKGTSRRRRPAKSASRSAKSAKSARASKKKT